MATKVQAFTGRWEQVTPGTVTRCSTTGRW
jgi:hypothetical protein